jgi:hypothetical protein
LLKLISTILTSSKKRQLKMKNEEWKIKNAGLKIIKEWELNNVPIWVFREWNHLFGEFPEILEVIRFREIR